MKAIINMQHKNVSSTIILDSTRLPISVDRYQHGQQWHLKVIYEHAPITYVSSEEETQRAYTGINNFLADAMREANKK